MKMNITTTLCAVMLLTTVFSFAQNKSDWTEFSQRSKIDNVSFRQDHMPTDFKLYTLDITSLKSKLTNVPMRGEVFGRTKNTIAIPGKDGDIEHFNIMDTQTMHPDLQRKFPTIRSYVGQSIENPGNYIRFSVTERGFHAQITIPGEPTVYIDPYTNDKSVYMMYSRKDLVNTSIGEFSCETVNEAVNNDKGVFPANTVRATDDSMIRVYELALSCTGEYAQMFAGNGNEASQKANVMSEMVVAMTRVNGIYEKEMGITFQMIPNNDLLIFLDPATDDWDGEFNDQTQITIDRIIGDANYDIGHNFNTSGGGNAGCIGCVCNSGNKGSGYTGLPNPTGDPFYIDYVAHEMGHQIGGYHTHNGTGTCLKSGNNTEVEPGSGSTIMGYAGICPGQDIQNQSDDYFNYVNIRDISANIQSGVSSTCFDIVQVSNNPPTANAGLDYSIPIGTAFQLTGVATDADASNVLTYTWEQNDNEEMVTPLRPVPTAIQGPQFRSRRGTTSPSRFFPQISDIIAGNLIPTWEVIPLVDRSFEFAFTVRDNVVYGGQTADDLMTLTSVSTAGPFVVTSQDNNTTWIQGETRTVTWDPARTNLPPVNSQIVDILFSATGDFTDTQVLANDVLNTLGTADIVVPVMLTSTGRIMVKAADNVFLDVNNANITIQEANTPTFFLTARDKEKTSCANQGSETFTFEYTPSSSFSETVTFSAMNLPNGATASFNPATANTTETDVVMTISGFEGAPSADYMLATTGASATVNKTIGLGLTLKGSAFPIPTLNEPADSSVSQSTYPTFMWTPDDTGETEFYTIEISEDFNFGSIVETATTSNTTYTSNIALDEGATYYWRIKPANSCAEGTFTNENSFTTGTSSCLNQSNNIPTLILSTSTMSSTINISEDMTLSDINVSAVITHPYIGDVVMDLISPSGTRVTILASRCMAENNLNATFDDAGLDLVCSGANPSISGTIKPQQMLSAFNGESVSGTWTLEISDTGIGDDGTLDSWTLEYCGVQEGVLATNEFNANDIVMYPNPTSSQLNIAFAQTNTLNVTLYDLLGRRVISKVLTRSENSIDVSSLSAGAYLVRLVTEGNQQITRRLIVE